MSVICQCPSCKAKYQVGDQYAGHTVKCPKCSAAVAVPSIAGPSTSQSPSSQGAASQVSKSVAAAKPASPSSSSKIDLPKARAVSPIKDAPAKSAKEASSSQVAATRKAVSAIAAKADDTAIDEGESVGNPAENGLDFLNDPSPGKHRRGTQAAADTPADDNDYTDIARDHRSSGLGSRSTHAYHPKKKKKGMPSWAIPAIAAAAVAIVAGIGYAVYATRPKPVIVATGTDKPDGKKPKVPEKKVPVLTIDWAENQRLGASLFVDGQKIDVPLTGPIQVPLPPKDQQYEFRLERKGFVPKEFRRAAGEDDQAYVAKDWESTVQGNDLEQDYEVAKKSAADHNKNVLIVFDASDSKESSFASKRFGEAVLLRHEFTDKAKQEYVCVYIDNLQNGDPDHRVLDASRNRALTDKFKVAVFPTVIVTDPKERPFGVMEGYSVNGVNAFLALMAQWDANSKSLFKLLDKVDSLPPGKGDPDAIVKMLDFLQLNDLDRFYAPAIAKLTALLPSGASKPPVSKETAELWMEKLKLAMKNTDQAKRLVDRFDEWKKTRTFKDHDVEAELHLFAAFILARLDLRKEAAQKCKEALACKPDDPEIQSGVEQITSWITGEPGKPIDMPVGSGTGFCIAQGNYVLTNHHVIHGAKKIMVHRNGQAKKYEAHVIADNESGDMALLKVDLPPAQNLAPIPLADTDLSIGEDVCALGYPGSLSRNLAATLTKGVVSILNDSGYLVTDCKVDHGSSGGPLCSVASCSVAGMVSAGTVKSGELQETYGLAIPVSTLKKWLLANLPAAAGKLPAPPPKAANAQLSEVVKRFKDSVVYIENIQSPPQNMQ
jgi:S1-C subfamily serine protease/thioredoxin-related protein